jgi:zinc protease
MRKTAYIFAIVFLMVIHGAYSADFYQNRLEDGLVYRIYKSSNLPIISIDIKIKAGSYFDRKFGESNIVANSLETCDTKNLSSDKYRMMVDKFGGKISVSSSKEFIDIKAKFPFEYADRMFCLASEMLKSRFDDKNFNFVKKEASDTLKSLQEDKDYLAIHNAFVNFIKQKSYSHTSIGTFEGIESTTRKDALDFFKRYVNADNMLLAVSGGGFKNGNIEKMIDRYFSFLKKGKNYSFGQLDFKDGVSIKNIIKPVKQSYIYIAFKGFGKKDKRYYASKVLAFILGGNLNSILAKDVRTKHGYAYSVFSFNYAMIEGGIFVIGLQTQNKFTVDAIKRIFEDIKKIKTSIDEQKIADAKRYLIGKNEIALQSSLSVASSLSYGYMQGIEKLPWVNFRDKINMVTKEDVIDAARYIFKKDVSIGIVSNKNYKRQLDELVSEYGY